MKKEDLKSVATDVLQKKYKSFQIAFYILLGLVIVMCIASFLNWQKSGFDATTLLPVFFIPMVLVNYFNVRKIKQELESRGEIKK